MQYGKKCLGPNDVAAPSNHENRYFCTAAAVIELPTQ